VGQRLVLRSRDGNTYNISAQIETNDRIAARIYKGISLFSRTEIMTRIAARSRRLVRPDPSG
jgi:hypothetical protein